MSPRDEQEKQRERVKSRKKNTAALSREKTKKLNNSKINTECINMPGIKLSQRTNSAPRALLWNLTVLLA